jgi:hypothetical protein
MIPLPSEDVMRRMLAVMAPLALVAMATAAWTPQPAAGHFSIVLGYSSTGWSAQCESGCESSWKGSFACNTACPAHVDAEGLVTLAEPRGANPRFSFEVERRPGGVVATSKAGTLWSELAWSCISEPCRARITEDGVAVLGR